MHLSWLYMHLFLSAIVPSNALHPGEEAEEGQFPYLAFIAINEEHQSTLCGGAILDETHIVTAAHCVTHGTAPINHELVKVTVGRTTIFRTISPEFSVANITVHPEYELPKCSAELDALLEEGHSWHSMSDYLKAKHDIAVLTLEEPLPMSSDVQKIDHLHNDSLPYGEKCEFAGWGLNRNSDEPILILQLTWTRLQILGELDCATLLLPSSCGDFCALDVDNDTITVLGDSGSPLVCHGSLIGLLSTGLEEYGYPDIFVEVSHYESFIEAALEN